MVSGLLNVAPELGRAVAEGLGLRELPPPMPKVLRKNVRPEVKTSPALSLAARPGDGSIAARRVAVLAADGADMAAVRPLMERLVAAGAVPRILAPRLGSVTGASGEAVEVDAPIDAAPSVLWDAVIIAGGAALSADGRAVEFVKDQYRHCKTILAAAGGEDLLRAAMLPEALPDGHPDPGLLAGSKATDPGVFVAALARHRHFERETDPPRV